MKKVSLKPKRIDPDDGDDSSIMDYFGGQKKEKEVKEAAPKQSVDASALEARLAALERANSDLQRANIALMSTPTQVVRDDPNPEINLDGLPDPVEDPKGYVKALQERIVGVVDSRVKSAQNESSQAVNDAARVQELWNDFSGRDEYSDIAADQQRVGIAAAQVVNRMQARGVDLNKYMYASRDMFFKDVKAEFEALFGALKSSDDTEDTDVDADEPTPRARRASEEDDDGDDGRSESVFGGLATSQSPKGKKGQKQRTMVDDIREMQENMGIF